MQMHAVTTFENQAILHPQDLALGIQESGANIVCTVSNHYNLPVHEP